MLLTAVALAVAAFAGTASAVTATFTNTKRFLFDSDGNQIDAYGANINCESTPLSSKPSIMPLMSSTDFSTNPKAHGVLLGHD